MPSPFLPWLGDRPEVCWRLERDTWGRGLTGEAATAVRDFELDELPTGPWAAFGVDDLCHTLKRNSTTSPSRIT